MSLQNRRSSKVPAPGKDPLQDLQTAISGFESALTQDQRQELRRTKAVPDAASVLSFTAELDAQNRARRGSSIASRLYKLLESVREFANIVDTFVQSHPEVAALVWGTVKFTMLVSVKDHKYLGCFTYR